VTGSLFSPDLPVTPGGGVNIPILFSLDVPTRTYTLTNVPAALSELEITDTLASAKGKLAVLNHAATGAGTGTSTLSMKMPAFTGASSYVEAVGTSGRNAHTLLEWGPYSDTYTRDAGAWILKNFTSDPSYSEATHSVTWTESAEGVSPEYIYLIAGGYRDAQYGIQWEMVAPYSEGTATLPTLPAEHAELNFRDADEPEVSVRQYKVTGGYDAVRAGFFVRPEAAGTSGALSKVQRLPPIQP
jgi:hypothetical protein